jgi:hypothetical protein
MNRTGNAGGGFAWLPGLPAEESQDTVVSCDKQPSKNKEEEKDWCRG